MVTLALDVLDDNYKEPLVLRMYNGLSYEEIGEICNLTKGNARIRVYRAKEKLKEILDPYLNDLSRKNN